LRRKLWAAGFRPLAIWTVEADRRRGKTAQLGKHPYGTGWQNLARQNPPHDAASVPAVDAINTGILCDGLRAVDFDIDDPAAANNCLQIALEMFPGAICRWRANSPRKLLLLRATEGEPPKAVLAGAHGKIEVLGRGQQFVAFGGHESGAELRWTDAPGDVRLDELPAASEDDVQTFLARCAPILGATAGQQANGEDHDPGEPQADTLRIAAALAAIPNDGPADWEAWNRVGMAVWRATGGSSAGWEAFNAWSSRNPAYDPGETRARWDHYRTSPPTQIGAGTIFHLAKQHGWRDLQPEDDPAYARALEDEAQREAARTAQIDKTLAANATPQQPQANGQTEPPSGWETAHPGPTQAGTNRKDAEPALKPINPADLHGQPIPDREWLVPHWIPMGRVTGLYGMGGEGKTTLAQTLATATSIDGAQWLGLHTRKCNSLLFFCEDDRDEMWRRQEDINQYYQCGFDDLPAMQWYARLGFDNVLMTFNDGRRWLTELFHQLLAAVQKWEAKLVVIDTIADAFGGNENDRSQARAFVQTALGGIARLTGAAVLALAHPSLAGVNSGSGSSGSAGWPATFRSHLFLATQKGDHEETADHNARTLTRVKANYASRGDTIELRWQNGVFVNDGPPPGILGSIERGNCDGLFLDLLAEALAEGRHVSENSRAGNYAPRIFARSPNCRRFRQQDLVLAMERLFAAKAIEIAVYRKPNRHASEHIVPATKKPVQP
jgi:RecA-family ATPase